ncbi:ABC transporter ATP-binding protein [candidate division KSB1 bacterium]
MAHGNNYVSEEDSIGQVYDSRLMKRLLSYLKPYKWRVLTALVLLLISSGMHLVGPHLIKIGIDDYIIKKDVRGLSYLSLIFLSVLILGFFLRVANTYIMQIVGQRVMYDMRMQLFTRLQSLSVGFFDKNPVGRLITRVTTDVDALNEMFASGVVTIFGDIFTLLGIVGFLLYYNAKLALVTFSVVPILFISAMIFKIKVRKSYREIRIRIARINAFLQESVTGMKVIQLFNREDKSYKKFETLNKDHLDAFLQTIFYYAVFFPIVEIVSSVAIALIVWYGGINVLKGALSLGALVAYVNYALRFFRPIQDLSEKYNILQGAMAASERIFKLLDNQMVDYDYGEKSLSFSTMAGSKEIRKFKGEIEFKDIWFAYNDDYVLRDISFKIEEGQKVAFVGATGAGKTSIINLLTRLYDQQKGAIYIDGIDSRNINKQALRKNIGVVLQDVFLFSGDLIYNISLGDKRIDIESIQNAARDVHMDKFISKLPNGYNEDIRERGNILSFGQKQLLAFSRALVYDPRILILDEATSNVDTETELLIQDALNKLMKGRTSLIIAHRLSTIKNADKIIVIHKGKIREEGTHQELLSQRGLYYKLYLLQYKDQEVQAEV